MAEHQKEDRDYLLWMLMILSRDIVYKAREKELGKYGITPEQSGAIFAIRALGKEATISNIGRRLMREPHSVSILLKRLESYGFIKRNKPKLGRLPATYTITEKGQEAYKNSTKRESIHRALSSLSKAEHANLELYLRKIMDATFKDMLNDMTRMAIA
jgi:DNA-binding MarR family transcriptional regulator